MASINDGSPWDPSLIGFKIYIFIYIYIMVIPFGTAINYVKKFTVVHSESLHLRIKYKSNGGFEWTTVRFILLSIYSSFSSEKN